MKKNDIDISIIIPVYNGEKFIKRAIESIKVSKKYKYEIIVIDDYSKDSSLEKIKCCKKNNNNVLIYCNEKNMGVSYSRNFGIETANGKYIAFLDSDDYIEEYMYDKMLDQIKKEDADICLVNYNEVWKKNIYKSKYYYDKIDDNNIVNMFLNDKISMAVWDKIFKKSFLIQKQISFEKNILIGEDVLFSLECILEKPKVSVLNEYMYNYYQNENSVMHKISDKMIQLANLPDAVKIKYQKKLEKEYSDDWKNFKTVEMLKSIHAISRCYNNTLHERKIAIKKIIDEDKIKNIFRDKYFSKSLKIEVFILRFCGIYVHLLIFPIYDKIKNIVRRKK